jgi:hypothetical protein
MNLTYTDYTVTDPDPAFLPCTAFTYELYYYDAVALTYTTVMPEFVTYNAASKLIQL